MSLQDGFADRFKVRSQNPLVPPTKAVGQLLNTTDAGQNWTLVGPTLQSCTAYSLPGF